MSIEQERTFNITDLIYCVNICYVSLELQRLTYVSVVSHAFQPNFESNFILDLQFHNLSESLIMISHGESVS